MLKTGDIDAFSGYHPVVNLLFFVVVVFVSMFVLQPVFLIISLASALVYSLYLNGRRALRFTLLFMLPLLVLTAILNPLFNHQGVTLVAYLWDGNPLTLESIVYGVVAATMLIAVITWFASFNAVITSDKLVYLFGRMIPAISLVLSMALRFVPRFKAQAKVITNAQKCLGRDPTTGNIIQRARHGLRILSMLVTWALENGIDTADSMKARGYGLPGRTTFSLYKLEKRDYLALGFLLVVAATIITGSALGAIAFEYLPAISSANVLLAPQAIALSAVWLATCNLPILVNIYESQKWKNTNCHSAGSFAASQNPKGESTNLTLDSATSRRMTG
ncbi:cobalt transporter [Actinomycetota bacterium]|nr:cobalt transporter [Actinomycetota bacterium]